MVDNHPGDSINNVGSKPINGKSGFDYNYNLAGTYRFGEIGVCDVQNTIPDEDVPLHSGHDVRSMNLKAPLLGNIKMHKEFIDVPLTVLLPKNYEKLFIQPQIGDDVDASLVGLNVQGFDYYLKQIFYELLDYVETQDSAFSEDGRLHDDASLSALMKWFIAAERFYSKGCLLSSLGIQLSKTFSWTSSDKSDVYTFDTISNYFWDSFFGFLRSNSGTKVYADGKDITHLDNWQILEKLRDASSMYVVSISFPSLEEGFYFFDEMLLVEEDEDNIFHFIKPDIVTGLDAAASKPLQMERPMAYQVACAEFFTNSHVDYMYSAQLWRQFLQDFYVNCSVAPAYFTLNGVDYEYDTCSANYVLDFFTYVLTSFNDTKFGKFMDWSRLIFGYNRSLRYVDYFTGSRTRPLAVGDVTVSSAGGYVNIVDTITKRWYAKFLNQVNRGKRKLSDYMRKLFPDLVMSRDYHDPMWLAHVEDDIFSPEIEGTVASDNVKTGNTTTSVLRSNGDRYAFEYHTQYYGVVIGVIYFDIKRYYSDIIERPNFNVDRNDYFNPYLQFVGDQVVYLDELFSPATHDKIFGYQGRNMELKQRCDYCFGAFDEPAGLDTWLFISNNPTWKVGENNSISPDFIRSRPSELNKFYSSLTDYSLAKYYHFVIVNKNVSHIVAPMIANPQLD